jgi:hypothetical protein
MSTFPSVSMASSLRTRTLIDLSERKPRARLSVATVGNPSGTAAIASESADLTISSSEKPRNKPTRNTTPAAAPVNINI